MKGPSLAFEVEISGRGDSRCRGGLGEGGRPAVVRDAQRCHVAERERRRREAGGAAGVPLTVAGCRVAGVWGGGRPLTKELLLVCGDRVSTETIPWALGPEAQRQPLRGGLLLKKKNFPLTALEFTTFETRPDNVVLQTGGDSSNKPPKAVPKKLDVGSPGNVGWTSLEGGKRPPEISPGGNDQGVWACNCQSPLTKTAKKWSKMAQNLPKKNTQKAARSGQKQPRQPEAGRMT